MFEDKGSLARIAAVLTMASIFYGISALIGPHVGVLPARSGLVAPAWASISALVYNAGSIIGYVTAGFLADAIGRKPYMYLSFSGAVLSGLLMFVVPQTLTATLMCVFILGIFTLGVFSWMPIYLPELFHTRVRSIASGIIFNLARLVAFPLPILTAFLYSRLGDMSSIGGIYPNPKLLIFHVLSAAINNLTKSLALEVAGDGILVNAIGIGAVATDNGANNMIPALRKTRPELSSLSDDEVLSKVSAELTPIGRAGSAREIAAIAAFLSSIETVSSPETRSRRREAPIASCNPVSATTALRMSQTTRSRVQCRALTLR